MLIFRAAHKRGLPSDEMVKRVPGNLPKRSRSQKIGTSAADLLAAALCESSNVVPVPQDRDLGIDFVCELIDNERPTGLVYFTQSKGTDEAEEDATYFSVSIHVETVNYWLLQPGPVFLFVVDRPKGELYWTFPEAHLLKKKDWAEAKSITFRVSRANILERTKRPLPEEMLVILRDFVPVGLRRATQLMSELDSLIASHTVESNVLNRLSSAASVLHQFRNISAELLIEHPAVQLTVTDELRNLVASYERLIVDLDYTPAFRSIMRGSSVLDEQYAAGVPREIIEHTKFALGEFTLNPSRNTLDSLLNDFARMIQLNKDIYFVLEYFRE